MCEGVFSKFVGVCKYFTAIYAVVIAKRSVERTHERVFDNYDSIGEGFLFGIDVFFRLLKQELGF